MSKRTRANASSAAAEVPGTPSKAAGTSQAAKRTRTCGDDAEAATPVKRQPARLSPAIAEQIARLEQEQVMTRAGWPLAEGLRHLEKNRTLVDLMNKHGIPQFLQESASTTPLPPGGQRTYTALCRIIVGQQLHTSAIKKIWARFEDNFRDADGAAAVTPAAFLAATYSDTEMEQLRSNVGLSASKMKAIVSLSEFYLEGRLTDELLLDPDLSPDMAMEYLTAVKGIGPWSVNMFFMFHLHLPDFLPLGDLGVRGGIAAVFDLKGKGNKGALDEKKDGELMTAHFEQFKPYRSLASWYMWRAHEDAQAAAKKK